MAVTGWAALYKKRPPEPWARYPHRCHTRVPPLHPKPGDFQAIRSHDPFHGGGLSAPIRTAANTGRAPGALTPPRGYCW
jgi:hypothetical protein